MFTFLREKQKVIYAVTAVAFLITIFAFWGLDFDPASMTAGVALKVNGQKVSMQKFDQAYNRYLQRVNLPPDNEQVRKELRKRVADELVNEVLLKEMFDDMGFEVTDEELKGNIEAMDIFRNEAGQPSQNKLNELAKQLPGYWWQNLEENVKTQIETNRAQAPVYDGMWLSDNELVFILNNLYLEAKLSHMLFFPKSEVSETDVRAYYERNKYAILSPEQWRARHVLVKLAMDAADSEVADAQARAEKILTLAKAGKPFDELAKRYSEDPGADEDGGDLGYFERGDMVRPFEDAVTAMDTGQIAGPVRTDFGLHVIQLLDRKPPQVRPLTDELIEELRPSAVTDTHWELARMRAQRITESVMKFPDKFDVFAKVHSQAPSAALGGMIGWVPRFLIPENFTNPLLVGEVSSGRTVDQNLMQAAFKLDPGEISDSPVSSSFGYHIIKLHEKRSMIAESGSLKGRPSDTDAASLRGYYDQSIRQQALSSWLDQQRDKAEIEYYIDRE